MARGDDPAAALPWSWWPMEADGGAGGGVVGARSSAGREVRQLQTSIRRPAGVRLRSGPSGRFRASKLPVRAGRRSVTRARPGCPGRIRNQNYAGIPPAAGRPSARGRGPRRLSTTCPPATPDRGNTMGSTAPTPHPTPPQPSPPAVDRRPRRLPHRPPRPPLGHHPTPHRQDHLGRPAPRLPAGRLAAAGLGVDDTPTAVGGRNERLNPFCRRLNVWPCRLRQFAGLAAC